MQDKDIIAYLRNNPQFAQNNPEFWDIAKKYANNHENISDFQTIMIKKLQERISGEEQRFQEFIGIYRENFAIHRQIYQGITSLIPCQNIEEFYIMISEKWRDIFAVSAVAFYCEDANPDGGYRIKRGKLVDIFAGNSQQFVCGRIPPEYEWVFGTDFGSMMLMRLEPRADDCLAMVGFHSIKDDFYQAGQSTDFVAILQMACQTAISQWI